jgi:hypothetical protein
MKNGLCKLRDTVLVSVFVMGVLGFAGCHQWEKNVTENEIEYTKFRRTENTSNPKRTASIGYLKKETIIGGHKYKGWLHLRSNDTVSGGMLAEGIKLNEIEIPADTWIEFDTDGLLKGLHLPANQTIQGHECIGSGGGVKGTVIGFLSDWRVEVLLCARNEEYSGRALQRRRLPHRRPASQWKAAAVHPFRCNRY